MADFVFCCNCIFFSRLGMILTEYSSIIQGARSNAACKNQLLGTFVLPLNKPNVFFSHSELSIGSSFCVQCAQIKGVESKIGC